MMSGWSHNNCRWYIECIHLLTGVYDSYQLGWYIYMYTNLGVYESRTNDRPVERVIFLNANMYIRAKHGLQHL